MWESRNSLIRTLTPRAKLVLGMCVDAVTASAALIFSGWFLNNLFSGLNSEYLWNLALNVKDCGLDGVVCSANDLNILRPILPKNFHFVTPGIRLDNNKKHDQQRVSSPEDAKSLGSTMLVIGRSITEDPNPLEVLKKIQLKLK